jgi:DNA-binding NarL/FixJ family response regulator
VNIPVLAPVTRNVAGSLSLASQAMPEYREIYHSPVPQRPRLRAPSVPVRTAIIDDDESLLPLAEDAFALAGNVACVGYVRNGHDALRELPSLRPELALLSLSMCDMTGVDCARSLKVQLPALRIIMLGTSSDGHLLLESLMCGAAGYLIKPFDVTELDRAIRAALRGGVSLCPTAAQVLARIFKTPPHGFWSLSTRQRQIVACLIGGQSDKEIAGSLKIGPGTVHTHLHQIFQRIGVHSRTEAVRKLLHVT